MRLSDIRYNLAGVSKSETIQLITYNTLGSWWSEQHLATNPNLSKGLQLLLARRGNSRSLIRNSLRNNKNLCEEAKEILNEYW